MCSSFSVYNNISVYNNKRQLKLLVQWNSPHEEKHFSKPSTKTKANSSNNYSPVSSRPPSPPTSASISSKNFTRKNNCYHKPSTSINKKTSTTIKIYKKPNNASTKSPNSMTRPTNSPFSCATKSIRLTMLTWSQRSSWWKKSSRSVSIIKIMNKRKPSVTESGSRRVECKISVSPFSKKNNAIDN